MFFLLFWANLTAPSKIYVGSSYGSPVFDYLDQKTLYVLKGEHFEKWFSYPKGQSVQKVKDDLIGLYDVKLNKFTLINHDSVEILTSFLIKSAFIDFNLNKNVFYTDEKTMIKSLDGSILKPIHGDVLYCDNNDVYFGKENPKEIGPDVAIYRYNIKNGTVELIVDHVMGDIPNIFPEFGLIIDMKLLRGEFRPIVFNMKKKSFVELDREDEVYFFVKDLNAICVLENDRVVPVYKLVVLPRIPGLH